MKIKRISLTAIIVILGLNLLVGFWLYSLAAAKDDKSSQESAYGNVHLLTRVMEILRQDYVDESKVSYKELTYTALRGMLASLDPHSQFMDPDSYKAMQKDTKGQFGGVGIVVGMKDNVLTVIAPVEDTPASRAGIMAGDRILKIDGKSTEKWNTDDAVKVIQGETGTKITFTIMRPKTREVKEFTLARAIITVTSVKDINNRGVTSEKAFQLGADKIGYIRITQFIETTADDFEKALRKLEAQGMEALIVDLRNNPGGLLDSAKEVVSKFVPAHQLIVYTEGRQPSQRIEYRAGAHDKDHPLHPNYPIVLLINGGSASGSEIVAGALQDLKRAILVGETTFGKGSVQSVLPMRDADGRECALRLTTSKYYTPGRRVIHEHGITPDIVVPLSDDDERKISEARMRLPEELPEEGTKFESLRDPQMERAIDVLKGVKIFTKEAKGKTNFAPKPAEVKP